MFLVFIPTVGDVIYTKHACATLEDLYKIKPYMDSLKLDEARYNLAQMLLTGQVQCVDTRLIGHENEKGIVLERLLTQTYLGNNKFMQYWKARFFDNKPVYVWFQIEGKEA